MEPAGWDYCGTQEMTLGRQSSKGAAKPGAVQVLVFKRPSTGLADVQRGLEWLARSKETERELLLEREKLGRLPGIADLTRQEAGLADQRAALADLVAKQRAELQAEKTVVERLAKDALVASNKAARDKENLTTRRDADKLKAEQLARDAQLAREKGILDTQAADQLKALAQAAAGNRQTLGVPLNARPADRESIQIIPLGESNAEKMAKVLTELFSARGTFQADERSNSLIVKADAKTLREVQDLLDRLDKQAAANKDRDMLLRGKTNFTPSNK